MFLGPKRLKEENTLREAPEVRLGTDWWIFATSGSGDGWLIRRKGRTSEVAFLNHDEESSARAHPLRLTFGQWLQLADLMSQVEEAQDQLLGKNNRLLPSVARDVKALMNQMADGLAKRFPYAL